MIKWILAFVIVILLGWVMLRSNQQMNQADEIIELSIRDLESAYYEKYDICGNLSNSFKIYSGVNKDFLTQLEAVRIKAINESISKLTTTEKGPFNFAKIQAQLDVIVLEAMDTVSNREDLAIDPNFKVLYNDYQVIADKCIQLSSEYNQAIIDYNALLSKFPNSIFSNLFGYKKRYKLNIPD